MPSDLVPSNSLITATADEGRALAIKPASLAVKAIQPDADVCQRPRQPYAENADSLTAAAHVVAIEFATVAAANDYWRDSTAGRA